MGRLFACLLFIPVAIDGHAAGGNSAPLLAGVAKVDITREGHPAEGPNRLWVKALALSRGEEFRAVIVTVDAVAIAGIGSIRDPYLANVRGRIEKDLGIPPRALVVNASHCHGVVAGDIEDRTVRAISEAWNRRVPVEVGSGAGREDSIQENRRLRLQNGREADVRHAYSLPPNEQIAAVAPIDPAIGILRLDRVEDGRPLALIYHFAVHPIKGIPSGGNTADLIGFASDVIESNLGDGSAMAFFLQGCGGDINPADYKNVNRPRDAEPLGQQLGLSVLSTANSIETGAVDTLSIDQRVLQLPRADHSERISEMEQEIDRLLQSLRGTTLDFETFLPLYVKYHVNSEYPSEKAQRYLQDELIGRGDWRKLDEDNRRAMDAYLRNIRAMEELTRQKINLALLKRHQADREKNGKTVSAEVIRLRIGDFNLVTFPAEVTSPVGLKIRQASPHTHTYVSGYTNGYLFYAPSALQAENRGNAQEDSDCLLAPEWEQIFLDGAAAMLKE